MQERAKSLRHSQKKKHSLSPQPSTVRKTTTEKAEPTKRRFKETPSPRTAPEKIRGHPRHHANHDWVKEWEQQSSPNTADGSPHSGGLLCVRTRSGWTSQTWQSQSEDLDQLHDRHKTGHKQSRPLGQSASMGSSEAMQSSDAAAEVQSLRNELQELHAENAKRRGYIIQELQEMIQQRQEIPRSEERTSSRGGEISSSEQPTQGWIQAEMDRLSQELQFKAQVAELLRTMLLKTKVQRNKFQSMTQVDKSLLLPQSRHSSMPDSSKSVTEGRHVDLQMEQEIADLEGHLKLLNDALEDEKQENYELAKDNALLREKASPSEDDEWYEMM